MPLTIKNNYYLLATNFPESSELMESLKNKLPRGSSPKVCDFDPIGQNKIDKKTGTCYNCTSNTFTSE
jgi:hypothetical protein